ncbi:HAD family hydrolase [Chamaesiphon polymorphus]|uniref:L-2-haloalkanoic acid dehalogenase n=1 Tax=Chamaesiphon polymorphus CCALA 037 TaxID=2107692 RepID=A0A2T1FQQ8_9CYAN|nr:HAD-IA family hydrolase [Chamaesiphon polymorphus]PSB47333.1 L-2-haloalkanoic acid dehalogenase [Chamaesiphon polymorphus CCALA 037]
MNKAVIFDLDGTLLDRFISIEQFIAAQYDRLIERLGHISKVDYAARFIELDCHSYVWKDKVYQTLVDEFKIDRMDWQDLLIDYETQFQYHCVPFPFLVETLDKLKQQGYLLGIISNGRGVFQMSAISGLGINDYFDVILISEIEKIRKPQPEIFHRAIDRLGSSAQNSVFVGDNPETDITGAKNARLQAIWKRNSQWLDPKDADATIDELNEIPALLQQFEDTHERSK